jgi:hypothetical protein
VHLSTHGFRLDHIPHCRKPSSKRYSEPSRAKGTAIVLVLSALALNACGPRSKSVPRQPLIGWRPVASWSGRGNTQTESFNMESGQWRIRWETSNLQFSKAGTFQAIVHSSVSGRFVEIAVEHQGAGKGVAYVAEDPRQFFLDIEASGVDWKVAVDDGVIGEQ